MVVLGREEKTLNPKMPSPIPETLNLQQKQHLAGGSEVQDLYCWQDQELAGT